MDNCNQVAVRLFVFCVMSAGICSPAFAYIDPNAGGLLFQLLTPLFAALVGGWLFLRRWIADLVLRLIRKVKGFARK